MRLQATCYCAGIGVIAFLQTTACTICFAPEYEYELPSTTTLYRWPLSEPTPTPFFTFKYNLEKGTGQFGGFLDPELQDSAMLGGLREDEFGYRPDEVVRLGTWNQQANDIAFARRKAYMAKSPHGGTKPVERDLTGWVGIAITMVGASSFLCMIVPRS